MAVLPELPLRQLLLGGCVLLGDGALEHLSRSRTLVDLRLVRCGRITDHGLRELAAVGTLERLNLGWCSRIGDASLDALATLSRLRELRLLGCARITDAGLSALASLSRLAQLSLTGCEQLTDHGIDQLRALPLQEIRLLGCHRVGDSGALALAGAKRWLEDGGSRAQPLVAIASGANMNFDRLRHVAERAEIGEHHEAVLGVTIPERAGAFLAFCRLLGSRAVTEFNYRYADARAAEVFVGISLRQGDADRSALIEQFRQAGYTVRDYSGNELAKLHIRHLVGGRARPPQPERILRFEFPERPGALLRFLEHLGGGWNISLFHYRSHGAAYGRVLAGFEVDPQRSEAFDQDLAELGYSYVDETANPAVSQFL